MLANIIFLAIGLFVGMALGCAFGENSEKDKMIMYLKSRERNKDSE